MASSSSSTSGFPSSRLTSVHCDLEAIPLEILDNIAYFTALAARPSASSSADTDYPAPPPHALRNLLLTCRYVHERLSLSSNPSLYARIFKAKFDVAPIARRYGRRAVTVEVLSAEFKRRCIVLKRIKKAGQMGTLRPEGDNEEGEDILKENLWMAYLMMTENDGHNLPALLWADIRLFLSLHHTQEMLRSALQPGYPPESEDRALAMHLNRLLADASILARESKEDGEEKIFVLRPYVFASHKFDGFFAPWTLRKLPVDAATASRESDGAAIASGQSLLLRNQGAPIPMPNPADGQSNDVAANQDAIQAPVPANPFLVDHTPKCRSTTIQHVGQTLTIRPPCLVLAAYHLFFGQIERDPAIVGLTAITRGGSATDNTSVNGDGRTQTRAAVSNSTPNETSASRQTSTDPSALQSIDHDGDVLRLISCHSPFSGPGLKPCFFAGVINGAWEGRFSFFDFDSYREMLAGRMRSLYEGPFGEQTQVWKLQEHFIKVDETGATGGKREGGLGSMVNAGFLAEESFEEIMALPGSLEELHDREREVGGGTGKRRGSKTDSTIRKRDGPRSIAKSQSRENASKALFDDEKFSQVVRNAIDTECLPQDLALFPQFPPEDGGVTAGYGYLPSPSHSSGDAEDQEEYEEEADDGKDGGRYEMLVSGSGHSAWGSFVLRGRIRAWDGMLILSKEYRPDGRGRWLYRGYITAGGCLIGRWRDSFTPGDMSGYEGPFVLNRRMLADEDA